MKPSVRTVAALLLLVSSLLLPGCNDFERNAYRTLKVAKVEYELLQDHAARAYLAGRLSDDQWNRFAVAGHRFIASHTLAADLMKTYQQVRKAGASADESQRLQAQITAVLDQLPALLVDLRNLLASFHSPAPPSPSSWFVIPSSAPSLKAWDEGSVFWWPEVADCGRTKWPSLNATPFQGGQPFGTASSLWGRAFRPGIQSRRAQRHHGRGLGKPFSRFPTSSFHRAFHQSLVANRS